MDTTTAAHTAGVTRDTIRTWCRTGAVAATKTAGRWVINPASLARRISLNIRRTKKETTVPEQITRADYETECATLATRAYRDQHLHGNLDAGVYDGDLSEDDQLHHRRALTVVAEKDAGTWDAPARKRPAPSCYYCGVPITRTDGECEDCGSYTTVAKWLA